MENKTTVSELSKNLGKKAVWTAPNGLKIGVKIMDVEVHYGMPYYKITPLNGDGLATVRDHIRIVEDEQKI